MLIDGVSKGGNLLLNVGPTGRGEIDYRARERLEGLGRWMKHNARSIYGCAAAPAEFVAPTDCRYTYNAETKRLYLHVLTWPFGAIHLDGLAGKIEYAQFLHDASEVGMRDSTADVHPGLNQKTPTGAVTLEVPVVKPNVEVPVIEIYLK